MTILALIIYYFRLCLDPFEVCLKYVSNPILKDFLFQSICIYSHSSVSRGYSGWYSGSSKRKGVVLLLARAGLAITTAGSLLPTVLKANTYMK